MTLEEFTELKKRITEASKRKERAEGGIQQLYKELKEKFGCKTVEQADEEIIKLQDQLEKGQKKLNALLKKLEDYV